MVKSLTILILLISAPITQALCVSQNKVTMYKSPNPNSPKTWVVGKYMPLQEIERVEGWIKVKDMEGDTHWVGSTQVTNKYRCVAVKTNVAQLRMGAGPQYAAASPMMTADRYTPFKRVETEGPWVQVENDFGIKAWIHEKNLWRPIQTLKMGF